MMKNKDYLTVKEYADIKGVSTQYVYRLLQTKLQPFVEVVDGRKCLKISVLDGEVANQPTNETNQTNQVANNGVNTSASADLEELKRKMKRDEELIDDLRSQIKEKDKLLQNQTEQILDLSKRMADITENNQKLQLSYQLLLNGDNAEVEPITARGQEETETEPKEPIKKGLFQRIFR